MLMTWEMQTHPVLGRPLSETEVERIRAKAGKA
jgi:hypothetical protein